MSPPRRRTLRPLLAVLCACACLMAMLLMAHAAPDPGEASHEWASPMAQIGDIDTAADGGDVDDDALELSTASAHPCGRGTTPFARAPRAATAATDPPQSPPPEA